MFPGASFKHSECTLGHSSSQSDKNNLNIAHKKVKGVGLFFSFKCYHQNTAVHHNRYKLAELVFILL